MARKRANNEGTITKRRDGRWEGKLIVGIKKDGSPDRPSVYGRTQSEVKEKLELLKGDLRSGRYAAPSDIKVSEWMLIWLRDYAKVGTRAGTYNKYFSLTKTHIIPTIGDMKLQHLQTSTIQKLFSELLTSGNARTNEGLSTSTVSEIHLILSQALTQAKECNIIKNNPVLKTKKPARESFEINPYTEDELNSFLDAVKDHIHYDAFYLECYTGLRRGELLGLKWNNVNFSECSITVVRSAKAKANEKSQTKSKSSLRTIPVGKNVMSVMLRHKEEQARTKALIGEAYVDNNLVFCQETGKPICARAFSRSFERVIARYKLRKIRFHDLRHTHASILLLKRVPIHVVSMRLGHSSIRITLDYYSHIMPGMQEQVVDLIEQMADNREKAGCSL